MAGTGRAPTGRLTPADGSGPVRVGDGRTTQRPLLAEGPHPFPGQHARWLLAMFLESGQGKALANPWHGTCMPHNTNAADVTQALAAVRSASHRYRSARGSARRPARSALYEAIAHAVRGGATQAQVSDASGFSKAQVSRVARGGKSGASQLPPAKYLIDTLPADRIVERYKAGESARQLGEAFACSRSTISEILKRRDIPRDARPGPPRTVVPEEEIMERRKQGESLRRIAKSYGVSRELIRRRVLEDQSRERA